MPTEFMLKKQVEEKVSASEGAPVNVYTCDNMDTRQYFFTNSHGIPELMKTGGSGAWVPVTYTLPMRCAPRDSVPSGLIETVDQLVAVFYSGDKLLDGIEDDYVFSEAGSAFLKNERYEGPLAQLPPGIKDELSGFDHEQVAFLVAKNATPKTKYTGEDNDE